MKRPLLSFVGITAFTAVIAVGFEPAARAQEPARLAFDVVSIKPNVGGTGMMMRNIAGSLTASNVPARQLIRQAYGLQDFQLAGGPDWIVNERFDVEARYDPAPVNGLSIPMRVQAMLKTLLAERFKLVAHVESREMPIFALVMARDDKRLGPQLKSSAVDCAAFMAARAGGPPPDGRGGPPPDGRRGGGPGPAGRGAPPPGAPFAPGERPQCGGRGGFGQMIAGGLTMTQLATQLAQLTNRVVVDRTGLSGGYDIDLKWTPTPEQLPSGPPPPGFEPPPIDPNGPSLFTALEEQLGLKLDATRGPVEVLVIDSIERPAEN